MTRAEREAHLVLLMAQLDQHMTRQLVTQAEMARRINSHPAVVSKVLKLKVDPRMSTVAAMLDSIDCELVIQAKAPPCRDE